MHSSSPPQHSQAAPEPGDYVASVRWTRSVPDALRALDAIESPDYADVVTGTVRETSRRTPEQWLHTMLEGVPPGLLLAVPAIQRVALGLRLQMRPSPEHVVGWKIVERGEDWMRLEAASWFLTGHVIVHVEDGHLSFATFVRYDRLPAAIIWPPVSLIHRQVALILVRAAARA
jgi:hypothetical protein